MGDGSEQTQRHLRWKTMLGRGRDGRKQRDSRASASGSEVDEMTEKRPDKWSMGILNDHETDEVPGSVLLLSKVSEYNEPLGLRNAPARTSASSLPSPYPPSRSGSLPRQQQKKKNKKTSADVKRTTDGKFVLEPQPSDSANDPLNWPVLRRDLALLSLGFYCMIGGGMTPILAAGFKDVAKDLDVTVPRVALTTGLYMMGLGVGSVILSPTAILFGKRPVYLAASVCFVLTSIWCALSPDFVSLLVARVFMGIAVSSVECLPSASIAEIYFLHEKAYRLGIYTLLLLGGKNLVPLLSAVIIQSLGWRMVFYIVAIIVGFAGILLFLFVPETFWDRTPIPHKRGRKTSLSDLHLFGSKSRPHSGHREIDGEATTIAERRATNRHAHFARDDETDEKSGSEAIDTESRPIEEGAIEPVKAVASISRDQSAVPAVDGAARVDSMSGATSGEKTLQQPHTPTEQDYFARPAIPSIRSDVSNDAHDIESAHSPLPSPGNHYTKSLRSQPPKSWIKSLKPYSGRTRNDNWFRVAFRPFILFAYPSILWSSLVYALSIGWLIVLSESVSSVYENRETYNFTALQVGLVYISPFVGGVLGTAVAGKVSDLIVRFLARKNGGLYEPEFRLVMAVPIAITTVIGLMGFGWAAQERDAWIVPTIFFGFISFGCALGSTTAITFAVDSYRQYAGEALVTLNFSKNILHGLVWSLFFDTWLDADGSKTVFIAIGGIQLACLLTTIPMYIFGKRGRMYMVRKNFMEKF